MAAARGFIAAALAALAIFAATQPAFGDTATRDLIPDASPPWRLDTQRGGALTAKDIYGDKASTIRGFVDAYEKLWGRAPAQGMADRLERYSSFFWAAYRLGQAQAADKREPTHTSLRTVPRYGSGAYEVTFPADANGYSSNVLVFAEGDYFAVVSVARQNGTPDHAALTTQADSQLAALPLPTGEVNAIGSGIGTAVLIAVGIAVVAVVIVGVVLLVVLRRGPRRAAAGPVTYSPDGYYWWDGTAWRPVQPPPHSPSG
jgi:hypothetical protein